MCENSFCLTKGLKNCRAALWEIGHSTVQCVPICFRLSGVCAEVHNDNREVHSVRLPLLPAPGAGQVHHKQKVQVKERLTSISSTTINPRLPSLCGLTNLLTCKNIEKFFLCVLQNLPTVFFGPRPHPEPVCCHGDTSGSEGGEIGGGDHRQEKKSGGRGRRQRTCTEEQEEKTGGERLCTSCDGRPAGPPTLRLRRSQAGAQGGSGLEEHRGGAQWRGGGAYTLLLCQSGFDWSCGHLGARSKERSDDCQRGGASGGGEEGRKLPHVYNMSQHAPVSQLFL